MTDPTTMPAADVMLKRADEPGHGSCHDCLTVRKSEGETRLVLSFTHDHGYTSTTIRLDDRQVAELIRHLNTALMTPNVAAPVNAVAAAYAPPSEQRIVGEA